MAKRKKIHGIRFCLDLLYPNRCPCCDEMIPWDCWLCDSCRKQMETDLCISEPCPQCGKPKEDCICETGLFYDAALGAFRYEGIVRSGLLQMKASENRNLGSFCGEWLGRKICTMPEWMDADGIVPVPATRGKRLIRGFNQAAWIARHIAAETNLPVLKDCLTKKRGGREQHTLNATERAKNTAQFQPADREIKGYRLILCDDILTTGSTVNRCAEILKEKGAAAVYVAAAAVTCRKKEIQHGNY